ncbi:MAG: 16S rRNA (cytosine(1402)-N(4))-methyltransferase RsmH [Alphaproteobacteria bacterium]
MTGSDDVAGGPAGHVPVLLDETIRFLDPKPGEVFVDGTFGNGGYSRALLATGASVVGIDRDPDAILEGRPLRDAAQGRLTLVRGRFGALDWIARGAGYEELDGVVLDVGVSSMQLDRGERGFSFMRDGPLDMRMSQEGPTAADLVNTLAEKDLARLIGQLGEEKRAGAVSRAIGAARAKDQILRTKQLADIVEGALGRSARDPIHPATRTFQALRIAVNQELQELADALGAAETMLRDGGRLVVVTFHSLEDRIVKRFLAERSREHATGSRHLPAELVAPPAFRLGTRGPILPGEEERESNPRSRSAKLRFATRTAAPARPVDLADMGVPSLQNLRAVA